MGYLIEARNMHKSFGGTIAVDGLSLNVVGGEIYGLVGPDGAGKTTTLRLLCGALEPDSRRSGEEPVIRILGYELPRQIEQARAQIGYLPQRFSLYDDLTVIENIRFFAEVRGLHSKEWQPRCREILEFVRLEGFTDRPAGYLSGGMKQKLGLAVALVHQPRVLLLDEPTTGVDPVTRQDFWQLILRLVKRGHQDGGDVAVLVSTPYMDEAARCTRVGFMRGGNLLVDGSPAELVNRFSGSILELRGQPLHLLCSMAKEVPGVEDAQMFGDRLHLRIQPDKVIEAESRIRMMAGERGGEITRLRAIPPQLEDVFISLLE